MTVEELINELQKVKDKTKTVVIYPDESHFYHTIEVYEDVINTYILANNKTHTIVEAPGMCIFPFLVLSRQRDSSFSVTLRQPYRQS